MDTLTHCVAGGLTPLLFSRAPKRAAIIVFGCLAGELPDIDAFFLSGTPEGMMGLHRGITHALLWQPVLMLVLVVPFYLYFSCKTITEPALPIAGPAGIPATGWPARPSLGLLCAISLTAQYIHLFLDAMTTFGTRLFLPFSDYRVALPALFIIDLLLLVPLLGLFIWAVRATCGKQQFWSLKTRWLARLAMVWIFVYPLGNLLVSQGLTMHYASRLEWPARHVTVLTEPFSPFVWKKVVWYDNRCTVETVFPFSARERSRQASYTTPGESLLESFSKDIPLFALYRQFAPTIVQTSVSHSRETNPGTVTVHSFADVRYLVSPWSPAHFFGRSDTPFGFEVKLVNNKIAAYRYLDRLEDKTSPWQRVEGLLR